MDNFKWLEKNHKVCKGKYRAVVCPFLVDNVCSIYEKRFSCCKNFPRKGNFYCSDSDCKIRKKGIRKNTKKGTAVCVTCRYNCCSQILVPKNLKATKKVIASILDMSCADCKIFFKK
ncbi:MAG TPA: hypothetical protein VF390_00660 [Patescibacteria group bacterium]